MEKVWLKKDCLNCGGKIGFIEQKVEGSHKKLSCDSCKKYVKFIGKNEVFIKVLEPVAPEPDIITLEEINFKLDLILDYFGIREA